MGEELVWGRAEIAEGVPCITYLPSRQANNTPNKTPTYNMENRFHIIISEHGIFLSSLLSYEHVAISSPVFGDRGCKCNAECSLANLWRAWARVMLYVYTITYTHAKSQADTMWQIDDRPFFHNIDNNKMLIQRKTTELCVSSKIFNKCDNMN